MPSATLPDLELRLQAMRGTVAHLKPDITRQRVAIFRQGSGVGVALEDAIPLARWEADHRVPGRDWLARVGAALRPGVALTLV